MRSRTYLTAASKSMYVDIRLAKRRYARCGRCRDPSMPGESTEAWFRRQFTSLRAVSE